MDVEAVLAQLQRPATVVTRDQAVFVGTVVEVGPTTITLSEQTGAGSVEYALQHDAIVRLELPGRAYQFVAYDYIDSGQFAEALTVMEACYRLLKPLMGREPEESQAYFVRYAKLLLEQGHAVRAIQVAEQLNPHIEDRQGRELLEDTVLLGYHSLGLEQAEALATNWIAARPDFGRSALGWYVLADIQLKSKHPGAALERALRPVVLSSQFPMQYLEHCYALAVTAATQVGDPDHALTLEAEMRAHGLRWPAEIPEL